MSSKDEEEELSVCIHCGRVIKKVNGPPTGTHWIHYNSGNVMCEGLKAAPTKIRLA